MNGTTALLFYTEGYLLLFFITVLCLWRWQIKQRNEKPPVEFKLLRGPGESLRRKITEFDENFLFVIGGAAFAPIIVGFLVLLMIQPFFPHMPFRYWASIVAGPMLIALFFAGRFAMRKFSRNRNDRLGYLGERAVGEALEPLIAEGYRVFHDVPAVAGKLKFNVDHIAVGPNGVFAIETKTRRKGRGRPGYELHKVAHDGRQLIWPWTEDTFGLKNAADRASWLSDWLNKMTGLGLVAQPVLVLPGWYVVPKGIGSVTVVNHKQLPATICRSERTSLSADQIDLVARQLDVLCRDVED